MVIAILNNCIGIIVWESEWFAENFSVVRVCIPIIIANGTPLTVSIDLYPAWSSCSLGEAVVSPSSIASAFAQNESVIVPLNDLWRAIITWISDANDSYILLVATVMASRMLALENVIFMTLASNVIHENIILSKCPKTLKYLSARVWQIQWFTKDLGRILAEW